MTDLKPEAYSPEQAAQLLDVHPETIRREISRGHLKAFKVGQQWRILRSELRAYSLRQPTTPSDCGPQPS
jgi:excisionase family DNA binding protein